MMFNALYVSIRLSAALPQIATVVVEITACFSGRGTVVKEATRPAKTGTWRAIRVGSVIRLCCAPRSEEFSPNAGSVHHLCSLRHLILHKCRSKSF